MAQATLCSRRKVATRRHHDYLWTAKVPKIWGRGHTGNKFSVPNSVLFSILVQKMEG